MNWYKQSFFCGSAFYWSNYGSWLVPSGKSYVVESTQDHLATLPQVLKEEGKENFANGRATYLTASLLGYVRVQNDPLTFCTYKPLTAAQKEVVEELIIKFRGSRITFMVNGKISSFLKTSKELDMFLKVL